MYFVWLVQPLEPRAEPNVAKPQPPELTPLERTEEEAAWSREGRKCAPFLLIHYPIILAQNGNILATSRA